MRALRRIVPLGAALLVAGCFDPDLRETIACAEGDVCPGNLECAADGICRSGPGLTDGATGEIDARGQTDRHAWFPADAAGDPPPRFGHSLTPNPGGGILLFSGSLENPTGDTWLWDGAAWEERSFDDNSAPDRRLFHGAAFDANRDAVVLFGGLAGAGERLADTWAWDGAAWSEVGLGGLAPSARDGHAMAYDGQGVVLFGGFDEARRGDTWRWLDGVWVELSPDVTDSPSPRTAHAMSYDPARERIVLFGGELDEGELAGDTWEWTGRDWVPRDTGGERPQARTDHAMAYDAANERVLLFGGSDADGDPLGDTWAWDGEAWRELTPSDPRPRQGSAMAPHLGVDKIVLHGGRDRATAYSDTWKWARP